MSKIGLVLIGEENIFQHIKAISTVPEYFFREELVGNRGDYTNALRDSTSEAAVILTGLVEKDYWISEALKNKKHVITYPPICKSYKNAKDIFYLTQKYNRHLFFFYSQGWYKLKNIIRSLISKDHRLGVVLAIDLKLEVSQKQIKFDDLGIVESYCYECLNLLNTYENPIDVVWARTRALALNRPFEDWAWMQLRFKNGIEATVHINGLSEKAYWSVDIFGTAGHVRYSNDRDLFNSNGLVGQYKHWANAVVMRSGGEEEEYLSNWRIIEWIQQAARMDMPIISKEVRIG